MANNRYDLDKYLELIEDMNPKEKSAYVDAYNKYVAILNLLNNGITFKEAEKQIFGMKSYSGNEAVVGTLNDFYCDLRDHGTNINDFDELMLEIESISKKEASSATTMRLIRYAVAEFGIRHGLDCYLFDANEEVFEDYYNRIMLNRNNRRGR